MTVEQVDCIVVGLGAMGAAVTYHCARMGLDVIGIDRYDPPHALGSSKAETRISRLAVGEGPQYLPFVRRSHEIWREIEERTGTALLHECGGVIISDQEPVSGQRWEDFVTQTAHIARGAGIGYETLEPAELRARHPFINIPKNRLAGYEPTAGLVMVERAVDVQLNLAGKAGAQLRRNERVFRVEPVGNDRVDVHTDQGTYSAANVVLAAGPWLSDLVPASVGEQLTVTRQVVYWFEVDDLAAFSTEAIPFVMWVAQRDEDYIGLFPIPPGGTPAVKVLGEQFLKTTNPDSVDRSVSDEEIQGFFDLHIAPKFDGIRPRCVRAEVCLYTNTPDDHFLIDTSPHADRVVVMSPCSGHGFKHSSGLGEAVAQRLVTGMRSGAGFADGTSDHDLGPFALANR